MKRDFSSCMMYTMIGLPIFLLLFIAALYVGNCGFTTNCSQASLPAIIHTPIPTLIPATLPAVGAAQATPAQAKCTVTARTILSAWVTAGYKESEPFQFTDANGKSCQATFTDVQPLFTTANLWYNGAPACVQCHNANISTASANMDLSSYAGIIAGAKRTSATANGEDILGGGNWQQSILNDMLFISQKMPLGRPAGAVPPDGPTIQAGTVMTSTATATIQATPQEEIAEPSNPGGPGDAINLTGDSTAGEKVYTTYCQSCHGPQGTDNVSNPGSDDGTVPPLNPIDSTLVSTDYKTFATNIDLFLQNGSTPEGGNPTLTMPAWGANGSLTQQQIADVIAYVISLNQSAGQEEIAEPSNPGGPGDAINLTGDSTAGEKVFTTDCQSCHGPQGTDNVSNPGSDDGTVPPLNPIDSTMVSTDYNTFATNIDLFLQNGSTPEGGNPTLTMPAWGANGSLTQQQIADVIAYIISLNK
jgi:mono/diheme cytochrome c family protein